MASSSSSSPSPEPAPCHPCLESAVVKTNPLSPLERLHPELQREVVSFLSAKDAIVGVGSASRTCRLCFLSGVWHSPVGATPLQHEPTATDEAHAASLARLLTRLSSGLLSIKLPPRHDRVNRIFGLACCSLEAPLAQLAELEGSGSLDEEVEGSDTGEGPAPHPLAQALAQGRLPALEGLDTTCRGWRFFKHETNADLLEEAINLGHLARLVRLNVGRGSVPGALGEAMAPGLHQPVLPNLHTLIISGCNFGDLAYQLGPDGGTPNLSRLEVYSVNHNDLASVGSAYAAGGLAQLNTLCLIRPDLFFYSHKLVEGMAELLRDVGASPHHGAALQTLDIQLTAYTESSAVRAEQTRDAWRAQLEEAQAQGIFPNATVQADVRVELHDWEFG